MNPLGILWHLVRMVEETGWTDVPDPDERMRREWQVRAARTSLQALGWMMDQLDVELSLTPDDHGRISPLLLRYAESTGPKSYGGDED